MEREIPRVQRVTSVLWPSFLISCMATILFFAAFDPVELMANTAIAEASRVGVYSVGFFMFWTITALTATLTCYFSKPTEKRASKPADNSSFATIKRDGSNSAQGGMKQAM